MGKSRLKRRKKSDDLFVKNSKRRMQQWGEIPSAPALRVTQRLSLLWGKRQDAKTSISDKKHLNFKQLRMEIVCCEGQREAEAVLSLCSCSQSVESPPQSHSSHWCLACNPVLKPEPQARWPEEVPCLEREMLNSQMSNPHPVNL